ncbi:MAG TPA: hypothetical protein VJS45_12560, partial [Acidimicrobiia bacterium]|nr:hypothetical protein [Acidimicrobiia bacterium]
MDSEELLSAYLTWGYDMVMGSFEAAPGTWPPPVASASAARRLRDVTGPIAEHAIWSAMTNEVLAKLGLPFVPGYLWGRAVGLGEPSAEAVAAAFAIYEPGLVRAMYEHARRQCGRAGFVAAREEATIASLHEILGDVDVADVLAVLRRGADAADGSGRALYSGLRSLGWPEDPLGQLWRVCDLLREHRGDSHMAVWVAADLSAVSINLLTEAWF